MAARTLTARLVAFVFALCLCVSTAAVAVAGPVESMDLKGLRTLIQGSKGKPVIINFFATWCPPCRAEIPMLVEMAEKYKDRAVFVGLTVDDARSIAKVPAFKERMGITYPVYQAAGDVVQNFGISSIPFNVGYNKKGKMVFAYSGLVDEEDFDQMLKDLVK